MKLFYPETEIVREDTTKTEVAEKTKTKKSLSLKK